MVLDEKKARIEEESEVPNISQKYKPIQGAGGPVYTIQKNKVTFQNLKSGAQSIGGSPPIKMTNPKMQYLA